MTNAANIANAKLAPEAPVGRAADGRATDFVAVEGQGDQYSGEKLLVGAYVFVWALLMLWIFMLWRKQASLGKRLDDLETAIDRAAALLDGGEKAQVPKPKVTAEGETSA